MCVGRFLIYVTFSKNKPEGISCVRWKAMLLWLASRIRDGDLYHRMPE